MKVEFGIAEGIESQNFNFLLREVAACQNSEKCRFTTAKCKCVDETNL